MTSLYKIARNKCLFAPKSKIAALLLNSGLLFGGQPLLAEVPAIAHTELHQDATLDSQSVKTFEGRSASRRGNNSPVGAGRDIRAEAINGEHHQFTILLGSDEGQLGKIAKLMCVMNSDAAGEKFHGDGSRSFQVALGADGLHAKQRSVWNGMARAGERDKGLKIGLGLGYDFGHGRNTHNIYSLINSLATGQRVGSEIELTKKSYHLSEFLQFQNSPKFIIA